MQFILRSNNMGRNIFLLENANWSLSLSLLPLYCHIVILTLSCSAYFSYYLVFSLIESLSSLFYPQNSCFHRLSWLGWRVVDRYIQPCVEPEIFWVISDCFLENVWGQTILLRVGLYLFRFAHRELIFCVALFFWLQKQLRGAGYTHACYLPGTLPGTYIGKDIEKQDKRGFQDQEVCFYA